MQQPGSVHAAADAMAVDIVAAALAIAPEPLKRRAAKLLQDYWTRKQAEALDELLSAGREGGVNLVDASLEHDVAHAMWKFFCAARDGAARRNLRLLVGLLQRGQLFADEFDRYAPILSRLTEAQILALVAMVKAFDREPAGPDFHPHVAAREALINVRNTSGLSPEQLIATAWELVGMGLLVPRTGGHITHDLTPLAREIIALALADHPAPGVAHEG